MPFSWSVGVSPTMTMSPTSSVARCCVLLWIFHKNNIFLFQGLASHIDKFVEEEVEVRHIPQLSDVDLRSLGFLTIGSRQRIRSAATAWVPQVICLCSFDSHVFSKLSTNTTICSSFWEKYDTRKVILMFLHIGCQSPGGARGDGCWTNSRCERGRRRERGLVNWFDV